MSLPRVLVVRSGEGPFPSSGGEARLDVVERVSHTIETVEPGPAVSGSFGLAVFTSRIAVRRGLAGPAGEALRRAIETARIVAVGEATAEALRARDVAPDLVAAGSAQAVLDDLPERLDGVKTLLPCGEDASPHLYRVLAARGADVTRCIVYRKISRPPDRDLESEILDQPFRAFCATSPAAARWLFESAGARGLDVLLATAAVALGPSTRAYLEHRGVSRISVPNRPGFHDALGLLAALATSPPGQ